MEQPAIFHLLLVRAPRLSAVFRHNSGMRFADAARRPNVWHSVSSTLALNGGTFCHLPLPSRFDLLLTT
jgi:hypothetical protein